VVEESVLAGAAGPGGVEGPEVSRTGGCPLRYNAASVTRPTVKSPGIAVVSRCNGNRGPLSLPPRLVYPVRRDFPPRPASGPFPPNARGFPPRPLEHLRSSR